MTAGHPVPPAIRDELRRLGERWTSLPLALAEAHLPRLYAVANDLADRAGVGRRVPQLGPAVIIDQLSVLAYDLLAYGVEKADQRNATEGYLLDELVALRRSLSG